MRDDEQVYYSALDASGQWESGRAMTFGAARELILRTPMAAFRLQHDPAGLVTCFLDPRDHRGGAHAAFAKLEDLYLTLPSRCATTLTERLPRTACSCPTYLGNLGPCQTFELGGNGRCAYCDHTASCHPAEQDT